MTKQVIGSVYGQNSVLKCWFSFPKMVDAGTLNMFSTVLICTYLVLNVVHRDVYWIMKVLKFFHWVWTVGTLGILVFICIIYGAKYWTPVSVPFVAKAVADTVDKSVIQLTSTSMGIADAVQIDIVSTAYQLGRLDFASLSMAFISVVFAILGIFGFMHLKDRAEFIAKKTTEERFDAFRLKMEDQIRADTDKYVNQLMPSVRKKIEDDARNHLESEVAGVLEEYKKIKGKVDYDLSGTYVDDSNDIAPKPDENV